MRTTALSLVLLVTACGHAHANPFEYPWVVVQWFFCERLGYGTNIEVQMYLLNREQVAEFLTDPDRIHPVQKTEAELCGDSQYFVFRAVDRGDRTFGGRLRFYLGGDFLVAARASGSSPEIAEWSVFPVGQAITNASDRPPPLAYMWERLIVR